MIEPKEEIMSDEEVVADETPAKKEKKCQKKFTKICIDLAAIPSVEVEEQDSELRGLGITAFDQRVYEENVMLQMDRALQTQQTPQTDGHTLPQVSPLDSIGGNSSALLDVKSEPLDELSEDLNDNSFEYFTRRPVKTESVDESSDCEVYDNNLDDEKEDEEVDVEDEDVWEPTREDYESDEHLESDDNYYSEEELSESGGRVVAKVRKQRKPKELKSQTKRVVRQRVVDDGSDKCFEKRIKEYKKQRLIEKHDNIRADGTEVKNLDEMVKLDNGLKIPQRIWEQLYPYQQTGVQWLWELHRNGCGGIVGDEMGLGKTIQVIAFLCGLSCSRFHDFRDSYNTLGPVILVCPATVMHQWVAEFHKWWPYFRVAVLHQTGSHCGKKDALIRAINRSNGILITSYSGVCSHQKSLLRLDWHYVILDEGHKIRNPAAQVTHTCKLFSTPHRLILSGSPIQNNLRELWSLFDFIYPGKLGTLPVFIEHFSIPITMGGYANATQVQIQVAFKMATILKDTIQPFLLRRTKLEVNSCLSLPSKNEQVLFCKLTDEQRDLYKNYIESATVKDILRGSTQIFVGLINLRKICNHPNLFDKKASDINLLRDDSRYYKRSGKLRVVDVLLRLWHQQQHKVLVFTQSRQMMKILEHFLRYKSYTYLLMDGSTSVQSRQPLIKQFNEDPNIFVFLLTTRVGGIGVNLTGANRVLIYDPDWNPSTDIQARERCWRIGQNKAVTIYRLLSSGTVEEKIYQRQIFKQYLTNRVLKDPKQRRFFKTNDLYELFALSSDSNTTESDAVFAGTDSEVKVNPKAKRLKTKSTNTASNSDNINTSHKSELSAEKVQELRNRAKLLSQMIARKFANKDNTNNETNSSLGESSRQSDSQQKIVSNDVSTSLRSDSNPKSNRKKTKKGTKFEGKRIKYLVKQDAYKDKNEKESKAEDEYVLKKLFKGSKVQSALQHDIIENPMAPDFAIAEREAETVAKQAITALKKSRELCLSGRSVANPLSGFKFGSKFGQKRKLGNNSETPVNSSSLINDIKKRTKFETEDNDSDSEDNNNSNLNPIPLNPEYETLLSDIRTYIAFQCKSRVGNSGEASTQELLDAFKDKLPPNQSAIFKSMLYQLCQFYRTSDGIGVWKLKPEFR
ncbi:unnamed protein product [Medioppia subpectinata]|uniref:DNA repair and recombination protein RAD54-like n=1 Tax=Medioppia subpectinata TaxID=1979941 RepID=A0A7R9PYE3_9ACAR|nr:unnamed protein product [Medioppia subpectinata]CAG2104982.1 unnamed protein product [Medioppia subpectinata]